MKDKIVNKYGKAVSKGRGITLCRFGGLKMVKQKGNYGKSGFYNAPERYGFYAFVYQFVDIFLASSTQSLTKDNYKRFNAIDGYIWTHIRPVKDKDIVEVSANDCWYKVSIKTFIKCVKKAYAVDSSNMSSKDYISDRNNPYKCVGKDHLEVFITRETIIN